MFSTELIATKNVADFAASIEKVGLPYVYAKIASTNSSAVTAWQ